MTRRADERGSVLVVALLASVVLGLIGAGLMRGTFADLNQGARSQATNRSLQAAEAGVNDYIAKLTEDHLYYAHVVHPAEATRRSATNVTVAKGNPWDGTLAWTYPNGRDGWADLGDGMEYDIQVFPPVATRVTVRIVATGRRTGDPSTARTFEAFVRTASIADYQMIANADIAYGAAATSNGKIYAGVDANGVAHSVTHNGVATANIYAENVVTGAVVYGSGARAYDKTTIRSVIKTPINFGAFTQNIGDVQRAAASGGIVLNDTTTPTGAWWLDFTGAGTVSVSRCTTVTVTSSTAPTCTSPVVYPVPVNGAISVAQDAIVSGTVKGRATVATPGNAIIGGNLSYAQPGTDVLGLMANQEVIIPSFAPTDLTWSAATIAITGKWRSADQSGSHGTMTYSGSTATNDGAYMTMFTRRFYNYDKNLVFLQPPYFPVLEDAYTIELLREIP